MGGLARCVAWVGLLWALGAVPPARAGTPQTGEFTTGDGARIHYLVSGRAGAAPALVLIPGWTLTASLWREQLDAFSDARQVIAVDSRSQGASARMDYGNTPERRAQDLHELLARLQLRRVVLVGWSQGAQDVAAYLQQFGTAEVAGVVFVDSPVSAGPEELKLNPVFSRQIIAGLGVYAAHPAEYAEGMVRSIFKRPHPELDLGAVIETAQQTPPSVGTAMLVADIFGADRRPVLGRIDRPALVIASAESPLLDAQKAMAEAIHGARWVELPDTGHAVFVDDPKGFDDALRDLLRKLPR
jgi:microsomal epoxide hydrolase